MELFPNYLALKAHIGFLPCVVYGSLTSKPCGRQDRGMVLVVERPQHLGRPRDVITITWRINGGLNGLEERVELWERARAVLCLSSALSQG